MSPCPPVQQVLVFPHLRVQNANAVSSPLTHGFPSMTAFLGLMWALERRARAAGLDLFLNAAGVVCHSHQEQVYGNGWMQSFCLTRNPLSKNEKVAAIVEEGRIHFELSLLFAVHSPRWLDTEEIKTADIQTLTALLDGMRVSGGTLLPPKQPSRQRYRPYVIDLTGNDNDRLEKFRKARMRLLPGFTLVEREDLLDTRLAELRIQDQNTNRLDAWLSLARINWHCETRTEERANENPTDPHHNPEENNDKNPTQTRTSTWRNDREGLGWIVPIPVGYGALGTLHTPGSVRNARDTATPFRFVENLYSIGEWISPHHLHTPQHMLWYANDQPETEQYRCRNDYRPRADAATSHENRM